MDTFNVYRDIAERTNGDIYVGVVGPVRTGKSTFITRFMEKMVIPNIEDNSKRQIAIDEMPQSSGGKTVMTTEPKFVPGEAVGISVGSGRANVRLIDCVGYMVNGASGLTENGSPRLVKTPWQEEEMPFEKSAEYGTEKVIAEHSTIGIVITTDGSFTDIPHSGYEQAEDRVINELKSLGKPFIVVINCKDTKSEFVSELKKSITQKHGVTVIALNVLEATEEELSQVLESVLLEFPLRYIDVQLPDWMKALPKNCSVIQKIVDATKTGSLQALKMRDYEAVENVFATIDKVNAPSETQLMLGEGRVVFTVNVENGLFYDVLSEQSGTDIENEYALMKYVKELVSAKQCYEKLKDALEVCSENGYGIVRPKLDEIQLSSPEIVKQGNRFAVKIGASASSMHLVKVDVNATVTPVIGSEKQCSDFVEYLNSKQEQETSVTDAEIYGRSLGGMVESEIMTKVDGMKESIRNKIRKVATKSINENKNNLIYVLI